jgi:hypothetical protein
MKTALMLAAMSLWSLSSLAMNPPLDVDTLTSVMEKVKAKQEKKPVPCVCQDGSGAAGLVATASSAPGNYRKLPVLHLSRERDASDSRDLHPVRLHPQVTPARAPGRRRPRTER